MPPHPPALLSRRLALPPGPAQAESKLLGLQLVLSTPLPLVGLAEVAEHARGAVLAADRVEEGARLATAGGVAGRTQARQLQRAGCWGGRWRRHDLDPLQSDVRCGFLPRLALLAERVGKRQDHPLRDGGAGGAVTLRGVKARRRVAVPVRLHVLEEALHATDVACWAGAHLALLVEAVEQRRGLHGRVDKRIAHDNVHGGSVQ
mmetsp:Transcript_30937/g.83846  ORF Transcript_30937/g.83846 Transcript_30937/m.83846 type:complete len:204 (+) Transcript_30937:121-732(+)